MSKLWMHMILASHSDCPALAVAGEKGDLYQRTYNRQTIESKSEQHISEREMLNRFQRQGQ